MSGTGGARHAACYCHQPAAARQGRSSTLALALACGPGCAPGRTPGHGARRASCFAAQLRNGVARRPHLRRGKRLPARAAWQEAACTWLLASAPPAREHGQQQAMRAAAVLADPPAAARAAAWRGRRRAGARAVTAPGPRRSGAPPRPFGCASRRRSAGLPASHRSGSLARSERSRTGHERRACVSAGTEAAPALCSCSSSAVGRCRLRHGDAGWRRSRRQRRT